MSLHRDLERGLSVHTMVSFFDILVCIPYWSWPKLSTRCLQVFLRTNWISVTFPSGNPCYSRLHFFILLCRWASQLTVYSQMTHILAGTSRCLWLPRCYPCTFPVVSFLAGKCGTKWTSWREGAIVVYCSSDSSTRDQHIIYVMTILAKSG